MLSVIHPVCIVVLHSGMHCFEISLNFGNGKVGRRNLGVDTFHGLLDVEGNWTVPSRNLEWQKLSILNLFIESA